MHVTGEKKGYTTTQMRLGNPMHHNSAVSNETLQFTCRVVEMQGNRSGFLFHEVGIESATEEIAVECKDEAMGLVFLSVGKHCHVCKLSRLKETSKPCGKATAILSCFVIDCRSRLLWLP